MRLGMRPAAEVEPDVHHIIDMSTFGGVEQVTTPAAVDVSAFVYVAGTGDVEGYVELTPSDDLAVGGYFVRPDAARRLAAKLLAAADRVERRTGVRS